jgi:hypothetical protein
MTPEKQRAWLAELQPGDEVAVEYGSSVSIETVHLVENDRIVLNSYRQGEASYPAYKVRMSYDRQTGRGIVDTAAVLSPVMPGHRGDAIVAEIRNVLSYMSAEEAAEVLDFVKEVRGRLRGPERPNEFLV